MIRSTIGVYGLGVMGKNLALNLEENGSSVSVYNRKTSGEENVTEEFISKEGMGKSLFGAGSVSEFTESLKTPRKILIMVKAGKPVDDVIDGLLPHLEPGDILIDGGNSNFEDTGRRVKYLRSEKIQFVGMGVSGGEEGARYGPSLMPGATKKAWKQLSKIFEPVAAKSFDGSPCCTLIGSGGSGHFVKLVHNGIEYADMQLLSEVYHLMKMGLQMNEKEISEVFKYWNEGPLASYLVEITSEILKEKDEDGEPLIGKILDSAGQKGTGKWTAISALEQGLPLPAITQSVIARFISSLTELRKSSSISVEGPESTAFPDKEDFLAMLSDAYMASRMVVYAEGFFLITETSAEKKWSIDPASVAKIWQGGCIIRSELLKNIVAAFQQGSDLTHLFQSPIYSNRFRNVQSGWRACIGRAASAGIPIPVMMSALAQYDSLRLHWLPANLIQAQRDYFGAHTYERIDKPRGEFFHSDWGSKAE
jgi:6-phosphogluconate dehydrogenase